MAQQPQIDWSQFTPIDAQPVRQQPPQVDWSQFTPITDEPQANASRASGVQAERSVPVDKHTLDFADAVRNRAQTGTVGNKLRALSHGAADTLLMGFSDEIGSQFDELVGRGSYEDNLDLRRARVEADEAFSPNFRLAGQVYGAIVPAGAAVRGATLGATAVRGAVAGATQGGLYGAGSGETAQDRFDRAVEGAWKGGVIGGAAPLAIAGTGLAARGIKAAAAPITNTIRGAVNPSAEAARRVEIALARDAGEEAVDATQAAQAINNGQPVALLDRGGETTRALGRSAANTSPEARQTLEELTKGRAEQQGVRVADFVNGLFNGGVNAVDDAERLAAAAQAANKPLFSKAFAKGQAVWDDDLAQLAQAPAIQAAIKDAIPRAANDAAIHGFKPVVSPFVIAQDGSIALRKAADGSVAIPNLQFWASVQRSLDNAIGSAKNAGAKEDVRMLSGLRRQFVGKLDSLVPEFAEARGVAAKFFDAEDALEAGRKFVISTAKNDEAVRVIGKMNPAERELFGRGFASELIGRVNEIGNNRDVVISRLFGSKAARQRISMALGPERAKQLEAYLHIEEAMQKANRAVTGNSTTARQLVEAGLAGGTAGGLWTGGDPTSITYGAAIAALFRRGHMKIDQRVARKVGEMLASTDPRQVQRGINVIAKSNRLMQALRSGSGSAANSIAQPDIQN